MRQTLRLITLSLLSSLGISTGLYAQYAIGGSPRSLDLTQRSSALRAVQTNDTIRLSLPSEAKTSAKKSDSATAELRPYRFALPIPTNISLQNAQWEKAPDGTSIGKITLKASGAKSIGLHCSRFYMPEGAKLFLCGAEGIVRGAFTSQNNNDDRSLSFAPLNGEWVTLEVNLPPEVNPSAVSLTIDKVFYGDKDLFPTNKLQSARVIAGEPLYNLLGTGLSSLSCAPNVVAYPEYQPQSRATLMIISESAFLSTGALINNTRQDGTAYVLTAAHNLNRLYDENFISEIPNDPRTVQRVRAVCKTLVFFFGFESPSKDQNIRASEEKTLSGAELVAYDEEHDMALVRITGLPTNEQGIAQIPKSYNPYWAGWELSLQPSAPFFGTHHALGSTKRLCIAEDQTINLYDYAISTDFQRLNREIAWKDSHWRIKQWAVGTTESGASGSPLFEGHGRIIGALTGGRSTCDAPYMDHYFSIARAWGQTADGRSDSLKLSPWLDPNATGVAQLAGYDPYTARPIQRISHFYGQNTLGLLSSYKTQNQVSGIGRVVTLGEGAEPLGVFVQTAPLETNQAKNPSYIIELSPIENGITTAPSWSVSLDNYNFVRYNNSRRTFEQVERTIDEDDLELFIPSTVVQTLPRGRYLLSLRTADDSTLDYPILTETFRSTSSNYANDLWNKTTGTSWTKSSQTGQSIWLDLLIQSPRSADNGNGSDEETTRYTSYYYGKAIYAQNPKGNATLRIYDLLGQLYSEHTLAEGENILSTDNLLPNQIYIVHIKGDLGNLSYKFRPKN